jgi:ABC-type polysaccharide/polyol phosphate export permease
MDVRTGTAVPHTEFFPPARPRRGPSRWLAAMRLERTELIRFWPVIQNMVIQDLRVRYHRSFMGFLWTLLNPILMMTILAMVFSQLFQHNTTDYAIHLFAGMVPWNFLAASLNDCAFCIISNEGLIRKIYLPKTVFPIARVLTNLTTFLLSLGALFLLMKPLGAPISWALLALPLATLLFAAFTLGLGLMVAVANTFYRDCGHLVGVFLQAWYFATPIVYFTNMMPEKYQWRFWLNPAYPFIRMFQEILRDGHFPQLTTVLAATGFAAASLGIGYVAFKSHENKLVFRL